LVLNIPLPPLPSRSPCSCLFSRTCCAE